MARDLDKKDLYESVKTLVECPHRHIHLPQPKLFTLFSIAFQFMLYRSTKDPGNYIIRIEDNQTAEKLARKSKDPSTRKFLQQMMLPRKLKYSKSMFFLDFFLPASWSQTSQIPAEKIKGAIIIKNTSAKPMSAMMDEEGENIEEALPPLYYLAHLLEVCPKTITIAYDEDIPNLDQVKFPFIKDEPPKSLGGVKFSKDIDWDSLK